MASSLEAFVAMVPDPCVVLCPVRGDEGEIIDFQYVDANGPACEYNGLTHAELMSTTLLELLPAHVESGIFDRFVKVMESGESFVDADVAFPKGRRNGPFHHFNLLAAPVEGLLVLRFRDNSELHEQARRLAESERRFRILAEHISDVVYECDPDGLTLWVSPSVADTLGWQPEQLLGHRALDFVSPEDLPVIRPHRDRVLKDGGAVEDVECRFLTATGDRRWMSVNSRPILDESGHVIATVVGLRDVQHEVLLRRAVSTLSATNAILVRAVDEDELLGEMCEVPVRVGGYLFAWYGRPLHDVTQSVKPVAASAAHRDYLDQIAVSWGDGPLGQGPTGRCLRTGEPEMVLDLLRSDQFSPWRDVATARGFRSSLSLPVFVDGALDGALMVYAAEVNAFDEQAMGVMRNMAAQVGYGLARLRDSRRLASSLEERRLLATAIDQSSEAILVTDTRPVIRYANPAALRSTGFSLEDVLAKNPRIFQSGLHDKAFYEEMWARLRGGKTWRGVLMNRRKNGEFFEEDTSITPVHDQRGNRIAYVAVKHDLTKERSLEAAVTRDQLDRDAIIAVMREVRAGDSLSSTASSVCRAMRQFEEIDGAMVILLGADGVALPVAVDGPMPRGRSIATAAKSSHLNALVIASSSGPFWRDLHAPDALEGTDPWFTEWLLSEGYTATGHAPLRWEGETVGVISMATKSANAASWMPLRLSMLAELGSFVGMLLGPQAEDHVRHEASRAAILEIIEHERFHVIFEPVVHLASDTTVGFEALTRFDDGTAPNRKFDMADAVGLGSALEAACARAALRGAVALPEDAWVAINFSPAALVDGTAASVLKGAARSIVVEITEHNEIDNYPAVRRAIEDCGDVRIAVDDAGSGFASLRHILELQPDIIKLDLALVRDIDVDPARQALAAGLRHFAALTGTTLIAEGVETQAEAMTVRQLGVEFAQGFLFDRIPTEP